MKVVTAQQMRDIELRSVEAGGSLDTLMESAGLAVARAIAETQDRIYGKVITVLVGPGNNGSDGLVAARHLAGYGATVRAFALANRPNPDGKRVLAEGAGVEFRSLLSNRDTEVQYRTALSNSDVVIDAVLGIGQSRSIEQPLAGYLEMAKQLSRHTVAVDVATGVDSDTGRYDEAGLPADLTLMLGYPKLGPLVRAGEEASGAVRVLDIGIPDGLDNDIPVEYLTYELANSTLPPRSRDTNKGSFGKTLIVGGSTNYLGAPQFSARAALRSGAGLVFLALPEDVHRLIAGRIDEAIYLPIVSNQGDFNVSRSAGEVIEHAATMDSVLIGPGLGQSPATVQFVEALIRNLPGNTPVVLDADALNIAARMPNWHEVLEPQRVLTPHPGEMARLLGKTVPEVQADRVAAATEAAERFDATVVLKGAATLVADSEGRLNISPWVNSGLAKGGTGDVLAGLLAGLLSQTPDRPFEMASLAVYLHGLAGDLSRKHYGERGMTAGDVVEYIPPAFMQLDR